MNDSVKSWALQDAQLLCEQYPYTFYKPSKEVVRMLAPGNQAKLIFEFQSDDPEYPRAERMWVTIETIDGASYTGALDNEPRYIKDLKLGDCIHFEEKHIIDTDLKDPVPSIADKYSARCFVTRKILYEGTPVGYLYREDPDRDDDSGWRILAGDESDEYMDDSKNIFWVSLGAVLREDDSILGLLDSPVGIAYERNKETNQFQNVADESG